MLDGGVSSGGSHRSLQADELETGELEAAGDEVAMCERKKGEKVSGRDQEEG